MSERILLRGLTARAFIIGVILIVVSLPLLAMADVLLYDSRYYSTDWASHIQNEYRTQGWFALPFLIFLLPSVIQLLLPKKFRLNQAELAFIFSMIVPVPFMAISGASGIELFVGPIRECIRSPSRAPFIKEYIHPLLFPKEIFDNTALSDSIYHGGAPVNWAIWAVPLAFYMIWLIVMRLFFLFGAMLLRDQYIDVENLPFPAATAAKETLDLIQTSSSAESEKSPIKGRKMFIAGIILGLLYQLWALDIHGVDHPWELDFSPYCFHNGPVYFDFNPIVIGVGLLLPISVVTSTPIFYAIVCMILPNILVAVGEMAPLKLGNSGRVAADKYAITMQWASDTNWRGGQWPIFYGAMFGLAIWPLIIHRRVWIQSLRRALKGVQGASDRIYWAGWGITGIAIIALFVLVGIPVIPSIVLLALISLYYLAMTRAAAEGGVYMFPFRGDKCYTWVYFNNAVIFGYAGAPTLPFLDLKTVPTGLISEELLGAGALSNHTGSAWGATCPIMWDMEALKFGSLTDTRKKDIFIGLLIAAILPVIISLPFGLWLTYTHGFVYHFTSSRTISNAARALETGHPWAYSSIYPVNAITLVNYLVGFFVVGALYFARTAGGVIGSIFMYLHPAGLIWAYFTGYSVYTQFIIAAVIRLVAYRFGGVKLYEEKIRPIGLGLFVSAAIWVLPRMLLDTTYALGLHQIEEIPW